MALFRRTVGQGAQTALKNALLKLEVPGRAAEGEKPVDLIKEVRGPRRSVGPAIWPTKSSFCPSSSGRSSITF